MSTAYDRAISVWKVMSGAYNFHMFSFGKKRQRQRNGGEGRHRTARARRRGMGLQRDHSALTAFPRWLAGDSAHAFVGVGGVTGRCPGKDSGHAVHVDGDLVRGQVEQVVGIKRGDGLSGHAAGLPHLERRAPFSRGRAGSRRG